MDSSQLKRLIDNIKPPTLIKPLPLLNASAQSENFFIFEEELEKGIKKHLKLLGIGELKDHLIWIPPEEFIEIKFIGEGGFCKVYKGVTKTRVFAMKEFKKNMAPEVSIELQHGKMYNSNLLVNILTFNEHVLICIYLLVGKERSLTLLKKWCSRRLWTYDTSTDERVLDDHGLRRRWLPRQSKVSYKLRLEYSRPHCV